MKLFNRLTRDLDVRNSNNVALASIRRRSPINSSGFSWKNAFSSFNASLEERKLQLNCILLHTKNQPNRDFSREEIIRGASDWRRSPAVSFIS